MLNRKQRHPKNETLVPGTNVSFFCDVSCSCINDVNEPLYIDKKAIFLVEIIIEIE